MKQGLNLSVGRETTDTEIKEIISTFSPCFDVICERNIVRLSGDWLPLIIDFTVMAVSGGVLYDALKESLVALREKFKTQSLSRNPEVTIRIKNETYLLTKDEIFLQSIDVELNFDSVEAFVDHIESINEKSSSKGS